MLLRQLGCSVVCHNLGKCSMCLASGAKASVVCKKKKIIIEKEWSDSGNCPIRSSHSIGSIAGIGKI